MKLKSDWRKGPPDFIKCSDLAKVGYPHTYEVLERGLEAIGWRYDINKDRWYPPIAQSIGEQLRNLLPPEYRS